MEAGIITSLIKYVDYLEDICSSQKKRSDDLKDYTGIILRGMTTETGRRYYKYRRSGTKKDKYLGKDGSMKVELVKEAHYYKASIPRIESNLVICHKLLQRLKKTDYDSIDEALPKVYKGAKLQCGSSLIHNYAADEWKRRMEQFKESHGPWYPEDLTNTTADLKMVRSKSEALIYNHYLSRNITFVYELPIEIMLGVWRHPDFSILCETDWRSVILHDHEGMYGIEKERKRYENDMYMYWQKGFIPGINIFYTFDDPRGGFDISVVQNIIDTKIRPK